MKNTSYFNCLILTLSLLMTIASGASAAAVSVERWVSKGTFQMGGSDYILLQISGGTMDQTGKVTQLRSYEDRLIVAPHTAKARAFLNAAPDSWFLNHPWHYWDPAGPPPPLGYNLPSGLQVISSHPHDEINRRYDVVGPVSTGTLKFQLEPQDVDCSEAGSFSMKFYVIASPVPLTYQWYRVLTSGEAEPYGGTWDSLIGTSDTLGGILLGHEVSRSYYVEISDGKKKVRSRTAKVLRRVGGHQDIVTATGTSSISGRVWHDDNLNDVDDNEPGVAGVEVTLGNTTIAARAITDASGAYVFHNVSPGAYAVKWRFSENYHVARPYIGGDPTRDCDAHSASTLISVPSSGGAISQESGPISVTAGSAVHHIDLGLFEKPKLSLTEPARLVSETDEDVFVEFEYQLSKPLRYTPLVLYFRTWSPSKGGATRLMDFRQEDIVFTTIPAGSTTGVVRFAIVGDNLDEPAELFYIEPDQFLNKEHIFRGDKPAATTVLIHDDDDPPVDPDAIMREYYTPQGNRILTSGMADYNTGASLFWEPAPEISTNGLPSFKVGPATGLIAHSLLTSVDAKGPRTISFEWKMSGGPQDVMTVFTQDPAIQYTEANPPVILAQLSGDTGWHGVTVNVPENHIFNINIGKLTLESNPIRGWVRNLDLGGADPVNVAPQPESLALDGLEDLQKPAPKAERILGVPSQNSSGVYIVSAEAGTGGASLAGSVSNFSVSTQGLLTGKVTVGGKAVAVRGSFDELGKFSARFPAPGGGSAALFLQMQTEVTDGSVEITGAFEDGTGQRISLVAQKPFKWTAKVNPCPYAGKYSLILPQRANGAPHLPSGEGYAAMIIDAVGKVTFAGALGDGAAFTASSSISPSGRIPLHKLLYGNKGSLTGVLFIRDVPDVSDLDGKLRWLKPANPKASLHKDGFDTELTALGSTYDPALRPPLDSLAGAGPWTLRFEISGGDFIQTPAAVETQLSVKGTSASLIEKAPPQGQRSQHLLRGKASLATGAVSFTYEDKLLKTKVSGRGLIFQKQNTMTGFVVGKPAIGSFVAY